MATLVTSRLQQTGLLGVQLQPKSVEPLLWVIQESLCVSPVLEPDDVVCASPAAATRQSESDLMRTGSARSVVVPSPSWPLQLAPHPHSRAVAPHGNGVHRTRGHGRHHASGTHLHRAGAIGGGAVAELAGRTFRPQAHSDPSLFSTKVCEGATATALTVVAQARPRPSPHGTVETARHGGECRQGHHRHAHQVSGSEPGDQLRPTASGTARWCGTSYTAASCVSGTCWVLVHALPEIIPPDGSAGPAAAAPAASPPEGLRRSSRSAIVLVGVLEHRGRLHYHVTVGVHWTRAVPDR